MNALGSVEDLGFDKGGCHIHQKGAPIDTRLRRRPYFTRFGIIAVIEETTEVTIEKAAQLPSAKYRPTRLVVDAALRRIGKSRHGGHKIANISRNCERI